MADGWSLLLFSLTGSLGVGVLVGAKSGHSETTAGWLPPAVLDHREEAPPEVADWPSPAKVRRLAEAMAATPPAAPVRTPEKP
jgi:hypothetical protein